MARRSTLSEEGLGPRSGRSLSPEPRFVGRTAGVRRCRRPHRGRCTDVRLVVSRVRSSGMSMAAGKAHRRSCSHRGEGRRSNRDRLHSHVAITGELLTRHDSRSTRPVRSPPGRRCRPQRVVLQRRLGVRPGPFAPDPPPDRLGHLPAVSRHGVSSSSASGAGPGRGSASVSASDWSSSVAYRCCSSRARSGPVRSAIRPGGHQGEVGSGDDCRGHDGDAAATAAGTIRPGRLHWSARKDGRRSSPRRGANARPARWWDHWQPRSPAARAPDTGHADGDHSSSMGVR